MDYACAVSTPVRSPFDPDRILEATETLEALGRDWHPLEDLPPDVRRRLHRAVAALHEPDPALRRKQFKQRTRDRKSARIERAESRLSETGIRTLRRKPVFTTPNIMPPPARPADDPSPAEHADRVALRNCYVCKRAYTTIHHFYDQLCPECADFNFFKRTELADLTGRVALVTGARVKIGYQAGLKLLRSGATLIVSTRFPRDAAARYAAEPDFEEWAGRLSIFGLDLRHTPSVEAFCRTVRSAYARLDFVINNACQTVRRPPQFYRHMMEAEHAAYERLPAGVRRTLATYEEARLEDAS